MGEERPRIPTMAELRRRWREVLAEKLKELPERVQELDEPLRNEPLAPGDEPAARGTGRSGFIPPT